MRAYIIRRLLLLIPTVLLVSLIVFITMRLIPGDIIDAMTAESFLGGGGGTASAAVDRAKMERRLGLDVPVATQYGRWIGVLPDKDGNINGILQGNLGNSMWRDTPVMEDVVARWPVTLELSIMGLILAQLIALPIGIYSALRQDTAGDYIGRSFAIACIAIPYFWLGTLVIVFPAIWWNYMPPLRFMRLTEDPITNLSQMVMPAIILGMLLSGVTMRMTRAMMLEVLRQDYIRTAWAKGLRERVVVIRHALKNALIPVITIVGLQVPIMIGGTVIIEKIFILPGMGSLLLDALLKRDYPVMSGVLVIFAGAMVAINLIVDVAYAYLDPRIHY